MALIEEVFVGNRLIPIDQAQDEINKLEAAIAEQNRILNLLTTETSLSANKALRQEIASAKELINAIAAELDLSADFKDADLIQAVKLHVKLTENAMMASRNSTQSIEAIAAQFDISNSNINEIHAAIDYLKHQNESLKEANRNGNQLVEAIATELKLYGDPEDADIIRQVKAERQAKECAMLAAKGRGEALEAIAKHLLIEFTGDTDEIHAAITDLIKYSLRDSDLDEHRKVLEAIAAQLGIEFTGDVDEIHRAIAKIKIHPNVSADFLPLLHEVLGLGNVFCENNIVSAIFNLKSKSANADEASRCVKNIALILGYDDDQFTYTEINTAIARLRCECSQASETLEAIANALGFEYVDSPQSKDTILASIASLKKSAHREDYWHQKYINLQSEFEQAWNTPIDRDELQSERDYYRGILDKLCDRVKVANIEALEEFINDGFIPQIVSQFDLRQQLAESQARSLKHFNRVVELEDEVRSLQETINSTLINKDGFTNSDLVRQLAETRTEAFKYMSRAVELENEVRSLSEPKQCDRDDSVDSLKYTISFADSPSDRVKAAYDKLKHFTDKARIGDPVTDCLNDAESMKLIRVLLRAIPE